MTLLSLKYCAGISFAVSYVRNGSGIIAAAPKDEGVEEEEDTQVVDVDGRYLLCNQHSKVVRRLHWTKEILPKRKSVLSRQVLHCEQRILWLSGWGLRPRGSSS